MSESKTSLGDGANKNRKRNLPSWMSSRDDGGSSNQKKRNDENNENEEEKGKGHSKEDMRNDSSKETKHIGKFNASTSNSTAFSKLMEGVVFVLSGFVNPERSTLRSQALAMGAEYQPDWNSDSTLLVCAFTNTPKFRQVEADCGTIVSKEWISECYTLKKLVDIEQYLMHAGKPWRKNNLSCEKSQDIADKKVSPPRKIKKEVEKRSIPTPTPTSSKFSKSQASNPVKEKFSASELKNWATDDLSRTISWLESQDEKPEPNEIKQIAIEGILTCLQDAIDSLEQKQDVRPITEQWNFVPRVVEELAKMEEGDAASKSKEDLCRIAKSCKRKYEEELSKLGDASPSKSKKAKGNEKRNNGGTGYDSDETIEMTEEEIDIACKTVGSKFCK